MSRGDEKPRQTAVPQGIKTIRKFFKNPLDKSFNLWYNTECKVRETRGREKMEALKKIKKVEKTS